MWVPLRLRYWDTQKLKSLNDQRSLIALVVYKNKLKIKDTYFTLLKLEQ